MSEEHVNPVAISPERDKNRADSFNVTALIAEARADAALRRGFFKEERAIRPYQEGGANQTHAIMDRLADALEAASRVPVQGEPNGDREES